MKKKILLLFVALLVVAKPVSEGIGYYVNGKTYLERELW